MKRVYVIHTRIHEQMASFGMGQSLRPGPVRDQSSSPWTEGWEKSVGGTTGVVWKRLNF